MTEQVDGGMFTRFTGIYADAGSGGEAPPWDREGPHPHLVRWVGQNQVDGSGRSAVVVGCGYGYDAAYVASLGFRTSGFDFVDEAVAEAGRRHPDAGFALRAADLFDLPTEWSGAFDLVVESLTVQSIPPELRSAATAAIAGLAAPGGTVLVIASALEDDPEWVGPPWPLNRADVASFADHGLEPVGIDQVERPDRIGMRPWLAEFRR